MKIKLSKFLSFGLIFILIFITCPSVFADRIFLKNGDRLSGKIVKKDGDKIIIQTEAAGLITILWSAVEKIVSDEPLNVELADGQKIKGVAANIVEADETATTKIEIKTEECGNNRSRKGKCRLRSQRCGTDKI